MSKIIGIDLGTTNSAVAVLEGTENLGIRPWWWYIRRIYP